MASRVVQQFRTTQIQLDQTLTIVYRNVGSVTYAIVISKDIDLQECGNFFDAFQPFVENNILAKAAGGSSKHLNSSSSSKGYESTYQAM